MDKKPNDTLMLWRCVLGIAVVSLIGMAIFCARSITNAMRVPERTGSPDNQNVAKVHSVPKPARKRPKKPVENYVSYKEPGDYELQKNLENHREMQANTLREEAEAPRDTGEERSLALSEEEIKALEKSGNLIY